MTTPTRTISPSVAPAEPEHGSTAHGHGSTAIDQLRQAYTGALARFLESGGEAPLQDAYELGRRGLTAGGGILEMVELHHASLAALAREIPAREGPARGLTSEAIAKAGEFFAETMSSFEMTHRAIGEANVALRKLNDRLEEEVQRIALALHDDAGQLMVAVHLSLDEAVRGLPPEVRARMANVNVLLAQVEERIRDLSHELRPAMLDHLGLVPAVEFLASNFGQRTGLAITVESTLRGRLPPRFSLTFYRVIQEALANVRRHAHATRVRIHIGKRGSWIRCLIADNGVGFTPARAAASDLPGLGLLGIRERLNALGGKVRIQSAEGRGTKLEFSAPLEQVDHVDSDSPRR
jgi:signal transduction histidine kinase